MLAVRLPPDIDARLNDLAALTGRDKDDLVLEALIEHIADLEDIYLAERRFLDNRAGLPDSISLEELMNQYGLAD